MNQVKFTKEELSLISDCLDEHRGMLTFYNQKRLVGEKYIAQPDNFINLHSKMSELIVRINKNLNEEFRAKQ